MQYLLAKLVNTILLISKMLDVFTAYEMFIWQHVNNKKEKKF